MATLYRARVTNVGAGQRLSGKFKMASLDEFLERTVRINNGAVERHALYKLRGFPCMTAVALLYLSGCGPNISQ